MGGVILPADELYRRGVALINVGRLAAGRRALQRAAERTDDTDLRARIAGTTAVASTRPMSI